MAARSFSGYRHVLSPYNPWVAQTLFATIDEAELPLSSKEAGPGSDQTQILQECYSVGLLAWIRASGSSFGGAGREHEQKRATRGYS